MPHNCGRQSHGRSAHSRSTTERRCLVSFSDHAQRRMTKRRVSAADVELAITCGRLQFGRLGAIESFVGKKEVAKDPDGLRGIEGLHVVVSVDGTVLTVFKSRETRKCYPAKRRHQKRSVRARSLH